MRILLALAVVATAAVLPRAEATPGALCRQAALGAAARHGVPANLMLAISDVETGTARDGVRGPWPWTLNIAGRGAWFDSRRDALRAAERALAGGERSFDVGCFQVNFHWHGHHFDSIDAMLDPALGADYAARFLKELYGEAGDWIVAAGWYHSRTPAHSRRYRDLVARAAKRIGTMPDRRIATASRPDRRATAPVRRVPRPSSPIAPGGVALSLIQGAGRALIAQQDR